ncbi:3-oxoacyl-ACP reductase FabG [Rhodococcus sp. USK13]|uniref:3-oxoacyl-ACP reductase FabG n=1 Tax=Rhodococcus sp. USK13 TaxID=2806442 RepID=UPI001BCDA26F|nr:3-oxoacyl-ACP reductase FabG [Rhodococcus sp. USK13]
MSGLEGSVAFITGAAQGIGAVTALRLARDGAKIAVVDLEEAATKATVRAIEEAGGSAIGVACDVSDDGAVLAAVEKTVEELGGLDIVVSNAGVTRDNLLHKMTDEDWNLVIDIHLKGSFHVARAAQAHMVPNKRGKMVFLSSTSALGKRGQTNYSTAKAGLQGMAKTLATELGKFNINVNAVAPGFVDTAMTEATAARVGMSFEDYKAQIVSQIPLGRTGRPEDVANVIAFLVSEDASYVTGQVIYVAGGPRA